MIYHNIKHEIIQCKACPLYKDLDYGCLPQWGTGSKTAQALVLNLRSTQESHLIEKPIEIKYSLLLHKILEKAKISETNVFVTNLIKCRCNTTPAKEFKANLNTCKQTWLYKELGAVPTIKVIVAMGKNTAQRLLDNKLEIDEINNSQITVNGIRVYATYSLEEIFRKGQDYMNHAIKAFEKIGGILC